MSIRTGTSCWDNVVNPVVALDGLCPSFQQLGTAIVKSIKDFGYSDTLCGHRDFVELFISAGRRGLYHYQTSIGQAVAAMLPSVSAREREIVGRRIAQTIDGHYERYKSFLHLWRETFDRRRVHHVNPAYMPARSVVLDPRVMVRAADWSDLRGRAHLHKPWLNHAPRVIAVGPTGDFGENIEWEHLASEIVGNVASPQGSRHIWLWDTKYPDRMAGFSRWLENVKGVEWPDDLVAMATTDVEANVKIDALRKVRSRFRAIHMVRGSHWGKLDLNGVDWVIIDGDSARHAGAHRFEIECARDLREQCRSANVAFFVKQFDSKPVENGALMKLKARHGGDWSAWPEDLKLREMPAAFHRSGKPLSSPALA